MRTRRIKKELCTQIKFIGQSVIPTIVPLNIVDKYIKAVTSPYTHLLIKRCLKGRYVACTRSSEMKVRLTSDAKGKKSRIAKFILDNVIFQLFPKHQRTNESVCIGPDKTPTNKSTMARWYFSSVAGAASQIQ